MGRLQGKRALITGGTSGIGLETARHFLHEGARVAITGNTPASFDAARKELGPDILIIPSDAGDVREQKHLAELVAQALGRLDILFINAGLVDMRPFTQFDEAGFDRSFSIIVKGPYFLIQALLPVFSNPASVVLNGSINAHIGMANTTIYGAAKAALISLAKTLSRELLDQGIRVNVVSAGPIATPLLKNAGFSDEQLKHVSTSIQQQIPLGRFGLASEIASAVVFFASDESAFTVGSELIVDGGMSTL
jgi:NAD(P)-dependent dehydrogenase (short-subunit alcohol dehydrogenase family)